MNLKSYGIVMALMIEMVTVVSLAIFFSYKLDNYLKTEIFVIILPLIVFVLSIFRFYKATKKMMK